VLVCIYLVYLIVERILTYKNARVNVDQFILNVKHTIKEGGSERDIESAKHVCMVSHSPVAKVISVALSIPNFKKCAKNEIEEVMQRAALLEIEKLETNLTQIGIIGSVAVYIGLLGTTVGLVYAFYSLAHQGGGGIEVVGFGVAQALSATIAGLFVAILGTSFHHYFLNRVKKFGNDITNAVSQFMGLNLFKTK